MSELEKRRPIAFTPAKVAITNDMSIPRTFRQIAADKEDLIAIERKSEINTWIPVTWGQFAREYRALAKGFLALGIQKDDHVALMCRTRYEFSLIDFALWSIGAQAVPIYETDSLEQAHWIIEDSHCRFAIAETRGMSAILSPALNDFDFFEDIFVINDGDLDKLIVQGSDIPEAEIDKRTDEVSADDLATIIYTSGTTGKPKGTRLTHRNLLHVAVNGPLDDELSAVVGGAGKRTLLFLPMAHVFARFVNLVALYAGNVVGYSPDAKNLVSDFQTFRPTYVLAVPRVFEKIYNAADANAGSGIKLQTFRYYAKVAIAYSRALQTPEGPSRTLKAQHQIGQRLVYSKLQNLTGGQLKWAISGGGPLGERLGHFFRGVGITIIEGYGATETSAPCSVNTPNRIRIGSVGPAYPGCRVTTDEDGELLVKAPSVFDSYHNNPEETAAAFTTDGWFRTGDIGKVDADGYVWITGRKKELIVTAGGKNVAPAVLEDRLRGHPLISQVVVVGDQRPYIAALITLDSEMLPGWLANHDLPAMSATEAASNAQVLASLDRAVIRANKAVSRAESIRRFHVLDTDFTVPNGYLTPSMKVKRRAVLADFAGHIDKLYNGTLGTNVGRE